MSQLDITETMTSLRQARTALCRATDCMTRLHSQQLGTTQWLVLQSIRAAQAVATATLNHAEQANRDGQLGVPS